MSGETSEKPCYAMMGKRKVKEAVAIGWLRAVVDWRTQGFGEVSPGHVRVHRGHLQVCPMARPRIGLLALLGLGVHGTLVPEELFFSSKAVAAFTTAGGVVTWGDSNSGGDSSSVASQLESGVKTVHPGRHAFAALKHDGSLVVWGRDTYGGTPHTTNGVPAAALASGVTKVVSGYDYFAALKDDGTVVYWGGNNYFGLTGISFESVSASLTGVTDIVSGQNAVGALKSDGTVDARYGWLTWGSDTRNLWNP